GSHLTLEILDRALDAFVTNGDLKRFANYGLARRDGSWDGRRIGRTGHRRESSFIFLLSLGAYRLSRRVCTTRANHASGCLEVRVIQPRLDDSAWRAASRSASRTGPRYCSVVCTKSLAAVSISLFCSDSVGSSVAKTTSPSSSRANFTRVRLRLTASNLPKKP